MSLTNVWVQTWADGLIRADQIVGIDAHPTPAVAGKPSRWLVDAVLASPIGSGTADRWDVTVLHRTLIQIGREPRNAPLDLARLLAQLDLVSAAGVITVSAEPGSAEAGGAHVEQTHQDQLRFRFVPFAHPEPGRHTDPEYL
ncbi:hypothetical protein ACQEVB_14410 [Pseudonocardia sp. CA-107938]|uniref:hypothetical protein n=1 Tax=Pseudonocardia sp. CA-107938 TaxID=3240021 RepID=UPI003D8CFD3A